MEARRPQIVEQVDREPVAPPARHHVEFGRRGQAGLQAFDRGADERFVSPLERKQCDGERCREIVGKRTIDNLQERFVCRLVLTVVQSWLVAYDFSREVRDHRILRRGVTLLTDQRFERHQVAQHEERDRAFRHAEIGLVQPRVQQ